MFEEINALSCILVALRHSTLTKGNNLKHFKQTMNSWRGAVLDAMYEHD